MNLTYVGPRAYSRLGHMNPGDVFDIPAHNLASPNWSTDRARLETFTVADLTILAAVVDVDAGDKPTKRSLVDAIMTRVEARTPTVPALDTAGDVADVEFTE